ncbi:unnamed protein product [Nippostrongylus brasiliensis]|uniref:Uncharacterized protein n=1 Tax=Nippostrongylus brasiliensis TaxID=27835 RepID=A0A0N4XLQ7_NIPBR|nr:unnamed protein product [Nippostrongylus brasiliensis]
MMVLDEPRGELTWTGSSPGTYKGVQVCGQVCVVEEAGGNDQDHDADADGLHTQETDEVRGTTTKI